MLYDGGEITVEELSALLSLAKSHYSELKAAIKAYSRGDNTLLIQLLHINDEEEANIKPTFDNMTNATTATTKMDDLPVVSRSSIGNRLYSMPRGGLLRLKESGDLCGKLLIFLFRGSIVFREQAKEFLLVVKVVQARIILQIIIVLFLDIINLIIIAF